MKTEDPVLYEKRRHSCWIVLNRPEKLNAINREAWKLLRKYIIEARDDPEVKAIVITGRGRAFSAGDDIYVMAETITTEDNLVFFEGIWRVVEAFLTTDKPIIAAVNGLAYGGGFEVILMCDFAVASENATFSLPEIKIGAYPPVAAIILPFLVPRKMAMELMLLGRVIDAKEALRLGLINKIVPAEKLEEEVERLIDELVKLPWVSVKLLKRNVNAMLDLFRFSELQIHLTLLSQTKDYRTLTKGFVKRKTK